MLELELLGHPKIRLDGESVQIPSSKSQALLYFLALSDRPYSRTALAGLLWGGKRETHARRNLRVELTKLRRALERYLIVSHSTIEFDHRQPHWLDISELRDVAKNPGKDITQTKRAADLVRGELLEDLLLRDAPEFETWLLGEREECRRLHRSVLQAVVGHCQAEGNYQEALTYAQQMLVTEPWHEQTHRQVIRLLAQLGLRTAALAQYESCRMILAEELGVAPSQKTFELIEDIKQGRSPMAPIAPTATRVMQPPHNLPSATTSFVGREQELAQVRELLSQAECRLLTLLGPGGIGKSRLALEAGRTWIMNPESIFVDGIFFVPLADADSETSLISAIISGIDISLAGAETPKEQLLQHLKPKRFLLILDNFEQLLDHAGLLLDMLVAAKDVKCLVTSRQRLELIESWNLDLHGLDIPVTDDAIDIQSFSAVKLFIERARRLDLGFDSQREQTGIIRTCRLVNGLPLAIELAAAWVRGFTCTQIADRIESDIDFLQISSPSLPERQRSLRAVFKQSWDLLQEDEQVTYARLSIFQGGFTGESAEDVTAAHLRVIINLVDKSLARRSPDGRYGIHQVLRQLAKEKLSPRQLARLEARYARTYAKYLKRREIGIGEVLDQDIIEEITAELENIRAAWSYSSAAKDIESLNLAADTLAQYYNKRGFFTEGADQFKRAADSVPPGSHLWARLQQRRAQFAFRLGRNNESIELGMAALQVLEKENDVLEMARGTLNLGNAVRDVGDHESARDYFLRSAEYFSEVGDQLGLASVENNLGVVSYYEEDLETAIDHFKAAYQARRSAGVEDTTMELSNIGLCLGDLGQYEEAAVYLEKSLVQAQELNDRLATGLAYHNLGNVRRNLGQNQAAANQIEESIRLFRELDSRDALAAALADLATSYMSLGNFQKAEEALLEGLDLERALNRPRGIAYKHQGLGYLRLEQGDLDQAQFEFMQVIKIAKDEHGPSLILGALAGLAVIKIKRGEADIGTAVLSSILTHRQISPEIRGQIQDWTKGFDLNVDLIDCIDSIDIEDLVKILEV